MQDILLVSFGAILGVNSRYIIYKKLEKNNIRKIYIILIINTFSSFCLGLFLSLIQKISSLNLYDELVLFFSIGFLGSLSTFSTLAYDLFDLFIKLKFNIIFNLFFISLGLGIIALALGFLLGGR